MSTYSQIAAEQEGLTKSDADASLRRFIAEMSDQELRAASEWPRMASEWKQRIIAEERKRRGI